MKQLTIGKLAELSGVSTDTLRYYEKMRLIKAAGRTASGYRVYDSDAERLVRFIRGAKTLNFTLEEIRELLSLESSDKANCADILKRTADKVKEAEAKIRELKEVQKVLKQLAKECPGDETPLDCCPILDHIKGAAKTVILIFAAVLALHGAAQAKPISYVGGTMVMQENDETGHTVSLDYTVTPNYAVGLYAKDEINERSGKDFYTVGPQVNTLIKRWNLPDGQGNIFNMTGAGISHEYGGGDQFSAWTGFLADYETRRIFLSYEPRFMYAGNIGKSFWERARVGVAPYLANYDDLNTWFMVQVDHHPSKEDAFVVTPLVRFFYKTTLMEAGYSSNNHLMFNWQLQF
jgi:DNA-binding transcriptional MerR regulator